MSESQQCPACGCWHTNLSIAARRADGSTAYFCDPLCEGFSDAGLMDLDGWGR